MIVFVNDTFTEEEKASISVFDRGFLYGDGCFETLRVYQGKPAFWQKHLNRLTRALEAFSISFSVDSARLAEIATRLLKENGRLEGILRIQVTRGVGPRGYSTVGSKNPSLIMSLHPLPRGIAETNPSWRLQTSALRIQRDTPLNAHKSSNKLLQVLAKQEAEQGGVDDVLLLTQDGFVSETSSANLFWIDGPTIKTPPESAGILPGITREVILEICQSLGWPYAEELLPGGQLPQMNGVFLSQSVWEMIPVVSIDQRQLEPCRPFVSLQGELRKRALESPFP